MRLLIFLILLGFPILEIYLIAAIARQIGWWLFAWLGMSVITGLALIKEARFAMLKELANALQQGGSNIPALLGSGRILLAGSLFIFPGVISDLVALALILYPHGRAGSGHVRSGERVVEGDFQRER